jgi:hypothetical protein
MAGDQVQTTVGKKRAVPSDEADTYWMRRRGKLVRGAPPAGSSHEVAANRRNEDRMDETSSAAWRAFLDERVQPRSATSYAALSGGRPNVGKRQGKPGRKELREKDLDPQLVPAAKAKEWTGGWQHYSAVEVIPPKAAAKLQHVRPVPTRFVLTDRNEALRTEANPLPVDLKARLVVLGNLEKDATFRRDAPVSEPFGTAFRHGLVSFSRREACQRETGAKPTSPQVGREERLLAKGRYRA